MSPASSFSPDLSAIFKLSDISRELSFGFPFLLREKKRGDSGRTDRVFLLARMVLSAVFFCINSGYILDSASRTVSGVMTKTRSPPAYGRKRKEKWRRGTNVGKRCLSRSVSVENLELYSQPNGCCKASPASSFSSGLAVIFPLSDIRRELSFGSPFSFAGKEKGDSGCTGRAPQWLGRYCRLFSLGINRGYILDSASKTVSPRTAMRDDKRRVFPGSRVGARDDRVGASGVRDDLCRYSLDPASSAG